LRGKGGGGVGGKGGEGVGGEMTQALYAHINNKTIKKPYFLQNKVSISLSSLLMICFCPNLIVV
jgi:hypothetical protein